MDAAKKDASQTRGSYIAGDWIGTNPREAGWLALLARLGIGFSPELLELEEMSSGHLEDRLRLC